MWNHTVRRNRSRRRCWANQAEHAPAHRCIVPGCDHIHPASRVDQAVIDVGEHWHRAHGLDPDWLTTIIDLLTHGT
jgi:hypothetical protein